MSSSRSDFALEPVSDGDDHVFQDLEDSDDDQFEDSEDSDDDEVEDLEDNDDHEFEDWKDFWKDECLLSSNRGYLCSASDSMADEMPPEIMYGGTSSQPEHPSLVITGGCCQTCEGLLKNALVHPPKPAPLRNWKYYSKLEESITRECNVCKIIRQTVLKYAVGLADLEGLNPDIDGTPTFSKADDPERSGTELDGFVLRLTQDPSLNSNNQIFGRHIEIKVLKKAQYLPRKPRGFFGNVRNRLHRIRALINDWDSSCQVLHLPCHLRSCGKGGHAAIDCPKMEDPIMPTRVLDVGSRFGEFIRLHVPEPGTRYRYLTLSYCWGRGGHNARTTASTFDEFQGGIPWEILPKTIQDAITIARNTGFRYIWVDALCIIQADKPGEYSADWDAECAKVAGYYRDSSYTIAGTGAENSSQGLFLEDSELSWTVPKFPIHVKATDGITSFDGYLQWPLPEFKTSVLDSPLLKRGWVAQERLSASKIVNFTREGVFWECRDDYASELSHHFKLKDHDKSQSIEAFDPPTWYVLGEQQERNSQINPGFINRIFYRWYSAVKMLSALNFSFAGDRLAAMSSIAGDFCFKARPALGSEIVYIAGLLGDFLPRGLAWKSLAPSDSSVSPTWTWASVNHAVNFLELDEFEESGYERTQKWKFHIEVPLCHVLPASSDKFGRVSYGRLGVKGWITVIPLSQYFSADEEDRSDILSSHVDSPAVGSSATRTSAVDSSNVQPPAAVTSDADPSPGAAKAAMRSHIVWDVKQSEEDFDGGAYHCLLLCSNDENQVALILKPAWKPEEEGKISEFNFQRVGMLITNRGDGIGMEENGRDTFWNIHRRLANFGLV